MTERWRLGREDTRPREQLGYRVFVVKKDHRAQKTEPRDIGRVALKDCLWRGYSLQGLELARGTQVKAAESVYRHWRRR